MIAVLNLLASLLPTVLRSRASLQMEVLALRQQLAVYQRRAPRPQLRNSDRLLWSCLSRIWGGWRGSLVIVQPRTVVAWQRRRFRDHWRRLSRPGRPPISSEIRILIRFRRSASNLGIQEVLTAHRSPWQNPYVERLIGTVRRECLDHIIVFNEEHLRRVLKSYFRYYHRWRTHRSLEMDAPEHRPPQSLGEVIQMPEVGGLQHHYERRAA